MIIPDATSPEDIMAAARWAVYERHPYMGGILFALRLHSVEGLGALAVDAGWRLYYDPKVVIEWHQEMIQGMIAQVRGDREIHDGVAAVVFHELGHVLREHNQRRGDREPNAWNCACVATGTKILMADGTEKDIKDVKKGDAVLGFQKGQITIGVVLNKWSNFYKAGLEITGRNHKIISSYDHRFLCQGGYVEIKKIVGGKSGAAQIYRLREDVHYGQLLSDDGRGDGQGAGEALSKRTVLHAIGWHLRTKAHREEGPGGRVEWLEAERARLFGWNRGRRRDDHGGEKIQQQEKQDVLSAAGGRQQYERLAEEVARREGLLLSSLHEQPPYAVLEDEYRWFVLRWHIEALEALLTYQINSSLPGYRMVCPAIWTIGRKRFAPGKKRLSVKTDPEDAPNLQRTTTVELEDCRAERITFPGKMIHFYDLETTCHSFIANGFLVHNCDREINDDVLEAGWRLPGQPLLPDDINMDRGLLAEDYFRPQDPRGWIANEDACKSPGTGRRCGGAAGNPTEWEKENAPSHERKTSRSGLAPEEGGDCHQATLNSPSSTLPEAADDLEQQIVLRQVAQSITDHIKTKGRGSVPGGLAVWAKNKLEPPRIDWRKQLAAQLRGAIASVAGAGDFTWRKSGRRSLFSAGRRGWPLTPAFHQPVPRVEVVLDTSGSMLSPAKGNVTVLDEAIREVYGIAKSCGAEARFRGCDTDVTKATRIRTVADIAKITDGGGGTSMVNGINAALKDRPNVIVVLTDGITDVPESEPPKVKLIWGLVGNYRKFQAPGTIIKIGDDN